LNTLARAMADPNLTEALAQKNPGAYRARFKRLSLVEQQAHAHALSASAYVSHCGALSEVPMVSAQLSAAGSSVDWLRIQFGGLKFTCEKVSWGEAARQLSTAREALPSDVGVTGSLSLGVDTAAAEQALGPGLRALGWSLTDLEFTTSNTTDGGAVRAAFATAATIILRGSTGSGPLRGHVCLAEHQLAAEPEWHALASRLGVSWHRT
jgi:hypothetical protein